MEQMELHGTAFVREAHEVGRSSRRWKGREDVALFFINCELIQMLSFFTEGIVVRNLVYWFVGTWIIFIEVAVLLKE